MLEQKNPPILPLFVKVALLIEGSSVVTFMISLSLVSVTGNGGNGNENWNWNRNGNWKKVHQ